MAGPNGSGKSTYTYHARDEGGFVVDPDAIARERGLSAIAAGRAALQLIQEHFTAGHSFTIETTLAGHSPLQLIDEARGRGYRVRLIYINTGDVEINIARVRSRVADGGHDVPEADIRRRFDRSIKNAEHAAAIAEDVLVLDNSGDRLVAIVKLEAGQLTVVNPTPRWAERIVAAARVGHAP